MWWMSVACQLNFNFIANFHMCADLQGLWIWSWEKKFQICFTADFIFQICEKWQFEMRWRQKRGEHLCKSAYSKVGLWTLGKAFCSTVVVWWCCHVVWWISIVVSQFSVLCRCDWVLMSHQNWRPVTNDVKNAYMRYNFNKLVIHVHDLQIS